MIIGAWGASITYGVGDSEALGWPGRLLRAKFPEYDEDELHFHNRGIPGNTSHDLLTRFKSELESIKPEIVFLSIGMNDSKVRRGATENVVSIEEYRDNIQKLISIAREYTDRIIVVGLSNVVSPVTMPSGSVFADEYIIPYRDALESAAKEGGLEYVSLFGILDTKTDFADGLHPNARGYDKIAEKILSETTF